MMPHLRYQKLLCCAAALALTACSVFEPPGIEDGDGGADAAPSPGTIDVCEGAIKINEVDGATTGSGADGEFIEIVNTSDQNQSIGGLNIARQRGSGPDVGKARAVPDGTVLPPGGFLYVVANVSDAQPGIQNENCIDAAPTPCLHVSWDIDADGESVYLLNRENSEILCEFEYPRTVAPGDSWGRVPDGSATLGALRPSPGGPNREP